MIKYRSVFGLSRSRGCPPPVTPYCLSSKDSSDLSYHNAALLRCVLLILLDCFAYASLISPLFASRPPSSSASGNRQQAHLVTRHKPSKKKPQRDTQISRSETDFKLLDFSTSLSSCVWSEWRILEHHFRASHLSQSTVIHQSKSALVGLALTSNCLNLHPHLLHLLSSTSNTKSITTNYMTTLKHDDTEEQKRSVMLGAHASDHVHNTHFSDHLTRGLGRDQRAPTS